MNQYLININSSFYQSKKNFKTRSFDKVKNVIIEENTYKVFRNSRISMKISANQTFLENRKVGQLPTKRTSLR